MGETTTHSQLSTFTLLDHSSEEPSQDGGSEESITHISTQKIGPRNRNKTKKTQKPRPLKKPKRKKLKRPRKLKRKKKPRKKHRKRKMLKPPRPNKNELLNQIYDSSI